MLKKAKAEGIEIVSQQHWVSGTFLGFDTETTGVDTSADRIVTAAIVLRTPAETLVRTWLINPGVPIPEAAAAIHGVTTEHAQQFGVEPAVALNEIASVIAEHLQADHPLVAFNASFDISILENELQRNGLPTVVERLGHTFAPVIDPLVLDRALDRYRKGSRKLGDLCEFYAVEETGTFHTADADVIATLDVMAKIFQKYSNVGEMSLKELHTYQEGAHSRWAKNFNSYLASRGKPADVEEEWLVRQGS